MNKRIFFINKGEMTKYNSINKIYIFEKTLC